MRKDYGEILKLPSPSSPLLTVLEYVGDTETQDHKVHLHHDFQTVQRGSARSRNGTCDTPCQQLPPPLSRLLLIFREFVRNS